MKNNKVPNFEKFETIGVVTKNRFKKICKSCGKFSLIKSKWNYCLKCYEKKYGKYEGADRQLYVKENGS